MPWRFKLGVVRLKSGQRVAASGSALLSLIESAEKSGKPYDLWIASTSEAEIYRRFHRGVDRVNLDEPPPQGYIHYNAVDVSDRDRVAVELNRRLHGLAVPISASQVNADIRNSINQLRHRGFDGSRRSGCLPAMSATILAIGVLLKAAMSM